MEVTEWNAGKILGISGSYWQAFALHTGVKLGVFTLIGEDVSSASEIAQKLSCDLRGLTMLLNALSAMGLLKKKQDKYANTDVSKLFLVKESLRYIGYIIMHHHHLVNQWSRLDEAVRSGKPLRERGSRNKQELESFLMGMFNMAMGIAPQLVKQIDLKGKKHLLDLGGGPGTYAIHFCLANPELKATVFDLSATRPFAEKTIAKFGLSDRIDFISGSYLKDSIHGNYDVAWLSHIFHGEGPVGCQMIIEKTVSAMAKGGLILVHEFILNDTFDGPVFPALFSLNMLVNTEKGQAYSDNQIRGMLAKAGLTNIRRLPFKGPNDSGIVTGVV
jgi:predicted O-methyltransferase YrrM